MSFDEIITIRLDRWVAPCYTISVVGVCIQAFDTSEEFSESDLFKMNKESLRIQRNEQSIKMQAVL